ncbi:MAG: phage holin family protein [Luteolibacter sp.]
MEPNGTTTQNENAVNAAEVADSQPESAEKQPGFGASFGHLFSTKLKILSIESKSAVRGVLRVVVLFAIAGLLLFFMWLLLMAGLIGILVEKTELTWFYSALIIGGVHFLVALVLALIAKSTPPASFEHTAAEFKKDREWLNQLKKNKS